MDSAFLLVVGQDQRSVAPSQRALVQNRDVRLLGFEPSEHLSWNDNSGRLVFGAWQSTPPTPGATAWHADADGLVMWTGHLRWRNRPWLAEDQWASQLAGALKSISLRDAVDRLHGVFAVARLTTNGVATVVSDPLGFRCVYHGERDGVVAVSSKAALVAEALAPDGQRPARDGLAAAWLAFSTYQIGDATGFAGVRVLPPGGAIEVDPNGARLVDGGAPWMPGPDLRALGFDDLVDLVHDDIAETLRAAADFPVDRHVIRLTGGKDSRLILAVALGAGLAQRFEYETHGPPDLADVQVACELAERFNLRHEVRFIELAPTRPYADRIREFTATTSGMINLWDLSASNTSPDELCVVGLCGEMLRSFHPIKAPLNSIDELLREFGPQRFGRLGLVQPDVAQHFHQATLEAILDDPSGEAEPRDLLDAFLLRNRLRFTRMGPQEEQAGLRRIVPLYSADAVRAAFALGANARHAERLHFEIVRSCSSDLATHRFAGPGWDTSLQDVSSAPSAPVRPSAQTRDPERLMRRLLPKAFERRERRAQVQAPPPTPKPEALMQRLQTNAFEQRRPVLEALVTGRDNRVWDYIDRPAVLSALERFTSLDPYEQRELYGALTAALWLGDELT